MLTRFKACLVLAAALGLGACSEVIPTTSHPAGKPEDVKIYTWTHFKYEKLGAVTRTVTSTEHWQDTADGTAAIDELRKKAADMGANGLLLVDDEHKEYTMVGGLYGDKRYLIPLRKDPLTLVAQAIYVPKE